MSFKVNATAAAYHVDILRFGYYQGNGARKVATLSGPFRRTPNRAAPTRSTPGWSTAGTGRCRSPGTCPPLPCRASTPPTWCATTTAAASLVPFVVRDNSSHSDIVVQASDTTWQAYNTYGGNSLYSCTGSCPPGNPLGYKGASKVSYNRPFHSADDDSGASWLTYAELPMISFLEANGYDVSYLSGTDVDSSGSLLLNHRTFVSSGHDEYWSGNQRANVEYARDHGVNLAFFSGNEVFWKTRWEPDGAGNPNRVLVTYKDTHYDAPTDPVTWTGTWRDPRFTRRRAARERPHRSVLHGELRHDRHQGPVAVLGPPAVAGHRGGLVGSRPVAHARGRPRHARLRVGRGARQRVPARGSLRHVVHDVVDRSGVQRLRHRSPRTTRRRRITCRSTARPAARSCSAPARCSGHGASTPTTRAEARWTATCSRRRSTCWPTWARSRPR